MRTGTEASIGASSPPRARRAVVAVGLALISLLLGPVQAVSAHADHPSRSGFSGDFGPYSVATQVGYADTGGEGVRFAIELRSRNSGRPIDDAEVVVTATGGGATVGPLSASRDGNDYEVTIPGTEAERWDLDVEISAERGDATITGSIPGVAELRAAEQTETASAADGATGSSRSARGSTPLLLALLAAVVAGVATGIWVWRLRRGQP